MPLLPTPIALATKATRVQLPPRPDGNLAPAFRIVRELLAERPRTFQQILQDGVALTSSDAGPSSAAQPGPQATPARVGKKGKPKGAKAKKAEEAVNVVPRSHPFVSATFLKNRILPVLSSQDLIVKSSKATFATPSGTFAWSLKPSPEPTDDPNPPPSWDTEAHWDRLLAGASPSELAYAYDAHRTELKSHKRLAALDDPTNRAARRTERDVWAWEGRAEGLTTILERTHLNVRKARGRPEKERARAAAYAPGTETAEIRM